ncbi:MAG: DUF5050 domain-containing protein [Clostridiales bacterium]|nr:DUF5050 domain-containing protein [Clostridiales bacterium]
MKKKLMVVITVFIICFCITGCGDSSGGDVEKKVKKTELEITSIEGGWKCVDIKIEEDGTKMEKKEIEDMYEMKADEIIQLTAYGDGTGEMIFFGDYANITWTEEKDKYVIKVTSAESTEEPLTMDALLKDNKLTIKFVDSYTADGVELESTMNFEFEHQGKVSKFFENFDINLSDKEVLKMSNFMATGQCIVVDETLYGNFGGEFVGKGTFSMGKIKKGDEPKVSDVKEIAKQSLATYLTEKDGHIYGILNNEKIIKVKVGNSKVETLYEGGCDYLQIVGDKMYYTDENYSLYTMSLDGKNKTNVIDKKEIYYTYILPNEKVLYQDDSDKESLHMHDLKTGEDVKLNDVVSYCPIIYGDHIYYTSPKGEKYTFNRLDLYSGNVETAPGNMLESEFVIENGNIVFGEGGLPTLSVNKWNKLSETNYGGMVSRIYYSDGKTRLYSDSNGKMYLTFDKFNSAEDKVTIGYNHINQ